jgi:hypothetical protein
MVIEQYKLCFLRCVEPLQLPLLHSCNIRSVCVCLWPMTARYCYHQSHCCYERILLCVCISLYCLLLLCTQSSSSLSDSSAIAEGGRYDDIVSQYRMQVQTGSTSHTTQRVAVGVRFNVGRMATAAALAQYQHSITTDAAHRLAQLIYAHCVRIHA